MTYTCPVCNGTRVITITIANMQGPTGNRYQSSRVPFVDRRYECAACHGRGVVECQRCYDTGLVASADAYGEYDGEAYCRCEAGDAELARDRAEIARIEAQETAVALAWQQRDAEPVYAGFDDIDAQPF